MMEPTHMLRGIMPVTVTGHRTVIRDGEPVEEIWVRFGFGRGYAWVSSDDLESIE